MEEDDSDSDCTVLLTDFVDKPRKVDAKRRRLSQLQDRSNQADQHDDENTARNDVSQNMQTEPNNNIEKNWLITKYLSGINKTNILNNTSDIRGNDYLHENAAKYAPVSKTYAGYTENTAKLADDSDIICLDSDDETKSNEKSQNQEANKGETEISSVNDLLHETKLIVLKPAAINARRATTGIFESNQMFSNDNLSQRLKENEPARLNVLKPSIINARRATTHFKGNNLECNSSNGYDNMSKNDIMKSSNNKRADKDSCKCISPSLTPLESNIPNTTRSTISGNNTGLCVATPAENSITSILTVSNTKVNTDISDSNIIGNKDFQQDTENKTVSNLKANKRSGNNETQIEPKRIKMNLKPKCSVKQNEDTEQMTNEKCKANEMCEEISNEEHVSHDRAINVTIAKCDGRNKNKSSLENNVCEAEMKLEEHILPGKQEISKVQYEQVISEAPTKLQISSKLLVNQDARNAKNYPKISQVPRDQETCDPRDKQGRSKMQENRDANKKADKLETSEVCVDADDNDTAIKVRNQQYSDHHTIINRDEIIRNEHHVKRTSSNVLDEPISNKISKKQKTTHVVDETAPSQANTQPETFEDQDSANEVLNTESAIKILNKTILSTTNEAQELSLVQNKLETTKVQNKQITSKACDNQEANKRYEEPSTIETLNREEKEEETCKVSGEETTTESHSEQVTDQLNKTPREVSLNVGAENNKRVLKFQIIFLKYILENLIKDRYPESGLILKNIIQTLVINARQGTFQTHVLYSCPECGYLSNYSSSLLNNTKSGVNKLNTDSSQNCDLCRGVREIHTSYLEKISNKKDHIGNKKENVEGTPAEKNHAKQQVGQRDKSITPETSSNSKAILEENDNNKSVLGDRSFSLAEDKEKEIENLLLTQSALETQLGNNNVSKENKINSETLFSETETRGEIKLTSGDMNENVSIKNTLPINNKRTNDNDEQFIIQTRIETATESNKTQNEENLKTKDNSSHLTTDFQSDNSSIENNKKMDQATQRNSNSAEMPKNILYIQNENKKNSCPNRDDSSNLVNSVIVRSNSDAEFNLAVHTEQNDYNTTAKKASSESPAETHMNIITNLNMQEMSLKPKSQRDNIITAEADQLKTKSDNNSNEVANETPLDLNISSVGVEENDKRFEKEAQMRNTDEVHKPNENIIISPKQNLQVNNNANEEEGSHLNAQKKDKALPDLASKEGFSSNKLSGATIAIKYVCPHCTSSYRHPSKFLRHLKSKYNVRLTKIPENCIRRQCPFCNYLLRQKSYNKHVARCRSDMHENTNVNKEENHRKNKNERTCSSGNNEQFETSDPIRFQYCCSICDETLTTDYAAARQHRTQFHPEFKHRHIIKKIKIGIKSNNEQDEKQNYDSKDTVPDNVDNYNTICGSASETITTTDITNQTTTNSRNKRKPSTNSDMSCNEDEERCDSDESLSYGDHSYKPSESSDDEDDNKMDENKTNTLNTSGEGKSTDKNAHSTSKRQHYTFICDLCNKRLYSDYATRKHRIHQHPNMQGRQIFKKIKNVQPKGNASKSKNESKRLAEDNYSSSSTDRVTDVEQVNKTRDSKVRKRCKANKVENASDSDWSTVSNSDCFDESSTTETVSEDEIIKASDYLVRKRKKRTTKLFGAERQGSRAATIKENAESEESDSDWIVSTDESADSQNTGTDESNDTDDEMDEDYDSQKTDVGESNDDSYLTTDEEDLPVSNNKTLNTLMRTSKKRKQCLLKFVNDSTDTDETDGDQQIASEESDNKLLTDHDNQCDNNESASRNSGEDMHSDDEIIRVSENTLNKRRERMSTLFDDNIEISAQNNDGNEQEQNNEIVDVNKSGSEEIGMNKNHEETPDLRKGENDHENLTNVTDQQVQNKEAYCKTTDGASDMDQVIDSTSITVVSKQNNTSVLSNVKLCDDNRHEIDLIDCLLKEYNTPNDQQNYSSAEKEKDGDDDREPDSHNDQTGANIDNQPLLPPEINNCLENIQITNVRSIANKLYIFICQECSYATDIYDDTIRHCQSHYNLIEDPVTYCNICKIKYDSFCFERHEISHDKYLINIKIKFSYQWLFSKWQAVFENNHMLLGEAEDMQVQSIYKTHCVKMTVKEHGPWQSALYLCAKCNIFVPPLDIEEHVQEKCTLTYYACAICHRAFLTHEMREHHKIYHTDEVTQAFKTIVFNEKKDERFNSTLIRIKLQLAQNKEKQLNAEIYKCICGLCFITLKQFKLHFVDCESEINDGVQCTMCSGLRRFLPSDLEIHISLHHSAITYEFRVQQITFQEERDYDSSEPLESTTDNNVEDLNIRKEMLKDATLSQGDINILQEESEICSLENAVQQMSIDTDLNINREVTKDELLPKNTNDNIDTIEENLNTKSIADKSAQIMSTADDVNFKRDFKKRGSKKNLNISEEDLVNKSTVVNATQIGSNEEDFNIKQEMLKDEVSSQNTIEEDIQECTKAFEEHLQTIGSEQLKAFDDDLNVKKEMLKDEPFSQNTNPEKSQNSQHIIEENLVNKAVTDDAAQINSNDKDLITKRDLLKVETLSENTIEEDTHENTEISEKPLQKRGSTLILVVQGHSIKGDMLKNESTSQNTNKDNQNSLHIEEIVNKIENPTQAISSNEDLNVTRDTLRHQQEHNEETNLVNQNAVKENLEIKTENTKGVETEDAIVIEDSDDDDVELVGEEVNDQRFVRYRAYPESGNHWELLL